MGATPTNDQPRRSTVDRFRMIRRKRVFLDEQFGYLVRNRTWLQAEPQISTAVKRPITFNLWVGISRQVEFNVRDHIWQSINWTRIKGHNHAA